MLLLVHVLEYVFMCPIRVLDKFVIRVLGVRVGTYGTLRAHMHDHRQANVRNYGPPRSAARSYVASQFSRCEKCTCVDRTLL